MTTITRLPASEFPWRYALHIDGIDSATFRKLIEALKREISPRARKWDAPSKRWLFRESDIIIGLLEQFNIAFVCDAEPEPEPQHRRLATDTAYRELYLVPGAPDFVIQAVYRALVKKHHPDAGGDTATMQRINAALEVINDR